MLIQMPIFFALYQVIIKIPGYIGGIKHVFAFSSFSYYRCKRLFRYYFQKFVQDNAIKNSYIPMSGKLSSDHVVDFLYSPFSLHSGTSWQMLSKFQGFADVLISDSRQAASNAEFPWT